MTDQKQTFEERLQAVQEIIDRIEEGKLPLEDSVKQFESGMKTLAELDDELKEMNRRLTVLQDSKEQPMPGSGDSNENV
jgi:exodeoxyribonuclease VII small subunit